MARPEYLRINDSESSIMDTSDEFSTYTSIVSSIDRVGCQARKMRELSSLTEISCAVLAVWDNILGPQLDRCWVQSESEKDDQLINYVVMHVLTCEMEDSRSEVEVVAQGREKERKLLFLWQQSVIVICVEFTRHDGRNCGFVLVLPFTDEARATLVIQMYPFLASYCNYIRGSLRQPGAYGTTDSLISDLDRAIRNLRLHNLTLLPPSDLHLTELNRAPFVDFLKRVYQGVLQCTGITLVMGRVSDKALVECVVGLISLVTPAKDRPLSVVCSPTHRTVQRFLYLQAFTYGFSPREILDVMPWEEVLANERPMAIVDVSLQTVQLSFRLEHYLSRRVVGPDDMVTVTTAGPFVSQLVDRMVGFKRVPGMIERLAGLAVRDIECRADFFSTLINTTNNLRSALDIMDWDPHDAEIFKAWTCKLTNKLKRMLSRAITPDSVARQIHTLLG